MRGPPAGLKFSWVTACAKELRTRSLSTSARTCSPNCLVMTASGALPGRKPFRRAVRDRRFRRCCTSLATSVAGTATSRRRERPPVSDRETSIKQSSAPGPRAPLPATVPSEAKENWCERRDSNSHGFPHWILSPARLPVPPLSPVPCAPDEPDAATPVGRASGYRFIIADAVRPPAHRRRANAPALVLQPIVYHSRTT